MRPSTLPIRLHIFGDESSHTGKHKYLVYGTVSCEERRLADVVATLESARKGRVPLNHEWHWSGRHYRGHYPDFVSAVFECVRRNDLRYRCLTVNTHHANHAEYSNGDSDLGLEKYIHLHLLTYAKSYDKADVRFVVKLDKRKYSAATQQRTLNYADRRDHGRRYDAFEVVEDVCSKDVLLVQAADILSGAIAWVWNEKNLENPSQQKRELVEHVAKKARIPIKGTLEKVRIRDADGKSVPLARGDWRTLGFETPKDVIDTTGIRIWNLHLRHAEEKEMRELSKAQLKCFAAGLTFGDLNGQGYKIDAVCPRCDRRAPNYLTLSPGVAARRLSDRFRPSCGKCYRKSIFLVRPDPLRATR